MLYIHQRFHSSLLIWRYHYLENIKYQIHNTHNRQSDGTSIHICKTCNNYIIPHGRYIHKTVSYMAIDTMYLFPIQQHNLCFNFFNFLDMNHFFVFILFHFHRIFALCSSFKFKISLESIGLIHKWTIE